MSGGFADGTDADTDTWNTQPRCALGKQQWLNASNFIIFVEQASDIPAGFADV